MHSDDMIVAYRIDATPWFLSASDNDIYDLATCGWGGDYPADRIVYEFDNEASKNLLNYLDIMQKANRDIGFEVHVFEVDALYWIRENRENLYKKIRNFYKEEHGTDLRDEFVGLHIKVLGQNAPSWETDPDWYDMPA